MNTFKLLTMLQNISNKKLLTAASTVLIIFTIFTSLQLFQQKSDPLAKLLGSSPIIQNKSILADFTTPTVFQYTGLKSNAMNTCIQSQENIKTNTLLYAHVDSAYIASLLQQTENGTFDRIKIKNELLPIFGYAVNNSQINWKWDPKTSIYTFYVNEGDIKFWYCYFNSTTETTFFPLFFKTINYPATPIPTPTATPIPTLLYKSISTPTMLSELSETLKESSGLINISGRIFTHNDSSDNQSIYEINTNGDILRTIYVENAIQQDWEDITQDTDYIYIGDIGNNTQYRKPSHKPQTIYKILKTDLLTQTTVSSEKIIFSYQDENPKAAGVPAGEKWYTSTVYDAEALFAYKNSLYILTKNWKEKKTHVYKISKTPGTYVLEKKAEKIFPFLISAAEANKNTKAIALIGYKDIFVSKQYVYILNNFTEDNFFDGDITNIEIVSQPTNFKQIESVTFKDNKTLYISSEKLSNVWLGEYAASFFELVIAN